MNRNQQIILWIGIFVAVFVLFTDQDFRDGLFNRGKQKVEQDNTFLLSVVTGLPGNSKGVVTT